MSDDMQTAASGSALIAAERQRQIAREGYDHAHDDRHTQGSIAWAASVYAAPGPIYRYGWSHVRGNAPDRSGRSVMEPASEWPTRMTFVEPWPWDYSALKQHDDTIEGRVSELVKAGALIAAEIDRLQRKAQP
jgi:hypothetical protein